jgi:hypothetical protein
MQLPRSYQASANHVSYLYKIVSGMFRKLGQVCPVLLEKVLFSGTHCGDHLTVRDVQSLSDELDRPQKALPSATTLLPEDARLVRSAIQELRRLVKAALKVNKPIAF